MKKNNKNADRYHWRFVFFLLSEIIHDLTFTLMMIMVMMMMMIIPHLLFIISLEMI